MGEEEDTEDFWVVNSDRVVRVRATPRHHRFDPNRCSPPIPIEYLDVIRFTDTNVKGFSQLVDCWVTDPRADQVQGPWIGKTSFNIRMPQPKKGWVIQNGRPTKVEENTTRPEYIWVEVWRNLSKKKQQDAIAHWENLKPRVEQARKDRDLDPIQKSDQEFWSILKKAIKEYRPPSAPGMPVQEQPEPHQDISLQIQQFSAYQDCLRKMQDRIKHLESQLPETASEDSKG